MAGGSVTPHLGLVYIAWQVSGGGAGMEGGGKRWRQDGGCRPDVQDGKGRRA